MTRTATRQAGKPDVKRTKTTKTTRPAPKKAERAAPSKSSAIKTYKAAIAHLNSLVDYEKMLRLQYNEDRFDLRKMQKLLHGLGNPHKQLKVLHVAGTKGKGSTCHMLAAMLKKAGHTVGLYTSPHIMDVRERIRINGEMISESAFTKYADTISKVTLGADSPTYYEFMTAMAMLCFAEKNLDYVVLETGMGGRLDATNVVTPVVCGITNISYDHMAQLGNTLDKIATEKAGIFKPGVTVISAPQSSAAEKALNKVAEKVGCNIRVLGKDVEFSYRFESSRATGPHTRICMATAGTRFDHLHVPLLGEHQAFNCGVALGMIDAMRDAGHEVSVQDAIDGLSEVSIEGRLETIRAVPHTIVDAAHNAASIRALMRAIGQNINYDSMVVIFGCAQDKDIDGMLQQVQLGADKIIFTNIGTPRSADPKELLQRFSEKSHKMAQMAPTLEEAYQIALRCVTREDLICITGSIYLIAHAKRLAAAGKLV